MVQLYGHTEIDDNIYVAMEMAKYGDLLEALSYEVVLEFVKALQGFGLILRWMHEIAGALDSSVSASR